MVGPRSSGQPLQDSSEASGKDKCALPPCSFTSYFFSSCHPPPPLPPSKLRKRYPVPAKPLPTSATEPARPHSALLLTSRGWSPEVGALNCKQARLTGVTIARAATLTCVFVSQQSQTLQWPSRQALRGPSSLSSHVDSLCVACPFQVGTLPLLPSRAFDQPLMTRGKVAGPRCCSWGCQATSQLLIHWPGSGLPRNRPGLLPEF